tara:strand:- start:99 stop:758 length:660 start_codon:yes stop_codon:yes gene_type:complete
LTVAVVGANRGIGLEFCRQLSERGDDVIAFCRTSNAELESLSLQVIEGFDVLSDVWNLKTLIESTGKDFDQLIHVSGIYTSESLDDLDFDRIRTQFEVNSLGPLKVVSAFRSFMKNDAKVSLLTSRMGSIQDNDSGGMYGYRMSKSALNSAGKSLAIDLKKDGVTVLILHPGWVRTDMTNHNGLIDTNESVSGMLEIIDGSTMDHSGQFFHTNGEVLSW